VTETNPTELRRAIGYVFQGIGLFPHMTVAENVGIVPKLLGWESAVITKRVNELMEMMGLHPSEYRQRRPAELSGGQQQRIGVARALAGRPKVLLMDEPFGALDPVTRDLLQQEFKSLQQSSGITVVMVTHDMTEALILADRIAVMQRGRLIQIGTPQELLAHPKDAHVTALLEMPRRQAASLEGILKARQP